MNEIFVDSNLEEDEVCTVLTVVAFGRHFKFLYPEHLDQIDMIAVDHDGEVFVASCGQRPVYDSGAWYMGDETVMAGKLNIAKEEAPDLMTYLVPIGGGSTFVSANMPPHFTPTLG